MIKIENVYRWKDTNYGGYYVRSENYDAYINESMVVQVIRFETKVDDLKTWRNLTLIRLLGNVGHGINGTDGIEVVTDLSPEEVVKRTEGKSK